MDAVSTALTDAFGDIGVAVAAMFGLMVVLGVAITGGFKLWRTSKRGINAA